MKKTSEKKSKLGKANAKLEKTRAIEERKFVKKWLGKTVYAKGDAIVGSDGMFYLVTAVDTVRGKIRIGEIEYDTAKFEILKSSKKKHWKRQTQFVNN